MADEIATGYAASGQNGTGTGAVIFSPTIDPLTMHLHNLGVLDQSENERIANQQQHLQVANQFLGALNPKLDGILPADADAIKQAAQQTTELGVKFLQSGAKTGSDEDLAVRKQEMVVNAMIEKSVQTNKQATGAIAAANIDKGKNLDLAATNQNIASLVGAPLATRDVNKGSLIQPQANVDVMGAAKTFADSIPVVKSSKTVTENGIIKTVETEDKPGLYNPADPEVFSRNVSNFAFNSAQSDAVKNSWDRLPLTTKSSYVQQATANTKDATLAPMEAYKLYAGDILKTQVFENHLDKVHGETEASKLAAKAAQQNDSFSMIPHMMAGIFTGDPTLMGQMPYKFPSKEGEQETTETKYGTTTLNTLNLGKITIPTANGDTKEIDNHPTITFFNPQDNKVYMSTVESENNYVAGRQTTPWLGTGFNSMNEALYYIGNTIKQNSKEEGLDPLKGIFAEVKRLNGYTKNGSIDPYAINPLNEETKALKLTKMLGNNMQGAATALTGVPAAGSTGGGTAGAKTYSIGSTSYKSLDEIKALSPQYTDEVIQKAIAAGKIKVQ